MPQSNSFSPANIYRLADGVRVQTNLHGANPADLIPHPQHLRVLFHSTKLLGTVLGLFLGTVLATLVHPRLHAIMLGLIARTMSCTGAYWCELTNEPTLSAELTWESIRGSLRPSSKDSHLRMVNLLADMYLYAGSTSFSRRL